MLWEMKDCEVWLLGYGMRLVICSVETCVVTTLGARAKLAPNNILPGFEYLNSPGEFFMANKICGWRSVV